MSRRLKCFLPVLLVMAVVCSAVVAADGVGVDRNEGLTSYVLHFGGGVGEKAVSQSGIIEFVDDFVLPRFPTGTTIQPGFGRWQNPDTGEIVRELSCVMSLEFYPTPENRKKLEEIPVEYVRRYRDANVSCFIKVLSGVTTELYYRAD